MTFREAFERVRRLEHMLDAQILVEPEIGHAKGDEYVVLSGSEAEHRTPEREIVSPAKYAPDFDTIKNAEGELRTISKDENELPIIRYAAARAIGQDSNSCFGYYPVRIWIQRHPDAATVAAGSAIGLAFLTALYLIAKYSGN